MAKIRNFLIRAAFSLLFLFLHKEPNCPQILLLRATGDFHSSQNPTVCPRNLQKPMAPRIFALRKIEQTKNLKILYND